MKQKRESRAEAVANHFGADIATVRDARYQSTRTKFPVYAFADGYFSACRGEAPKGWSIVGGWRGWNIIKENEA